MADASPEILSPLELLALESPRALAVVGPDGCIIEANDAFASRTGVPRARLKGMQAPSLKIAAAGSWHEVHAAGGRRLLDCGTTSTPPPAGSTGESLLLGAVEREMDPDMDLPKSLQAICDRLPEQYGVHAAALLCRSSRRSPWDTAVSTLEEQPDPASLLALLRSREVTTDSGSLRIAGDDEAARLAEHWPAARKAGLAHFAVLGVRMWDDPALHVFFLAKDGSALDRAFMESRLPTTVLVLRADMSRAWLFNEIREKNRELEETVSQLRVAERAREEFFRFLIHDLNKPLAAIIGTAGRLSGHEQMPASLRSRTERISAAATRLRDTVAKLLEYERIRRGELSLDIGPVELGPLVWEITQLLADKYGELDITVAGRRLDQAPDLPAVTARGDILQIGRIVQNLVDNALKFCGRTVRIDLEEQGETAVFSIWNDGQTIPPEDRPRIFTEFYRRGTGREIGGYGIGLASARFLAENQDGSIHIDGPDGGTRFRVLLPRERRTEVRLRPPDGIL